MTYNVFDVTLSLAQLVAKCDSEAVGQIELECETA